ncbi:MAG: hypothetical protein LIQ30_12980 [Planctomycetes bacterium]|nr:hypothetical protein [Planctomycetota bacterium]
MFHRTILAILLVLTPTMSRAFAHDQVPTLPDGVVASITVKSPADLVEKINAYTVASSKATASALPPGLVTMLSQMYLPFPFALWQSGEPAHLIIVPNQEETGFDEVGILQVDDYETFANDLQDNGWTMGEPSEEESADGLQPFLTPGGDVLVLADLGDGTVAVAETGPAIRRAVLDTEWLPAYAFDSDADAVVVFPMTGDASVLTEQFNLVFHEGQEKFLETLKEFNVTEQFSQGVASLIREYGPQIVGLIGGWRGGVVELSVDANNILLDAAGDFSEESLFHELAIQAEENGDVDLDAAPDFGSGAVSVGVGTSMETILKNGRERMTALNRTVIDTLFPDLAEDMAAVNEAVWDSGLGQTTMANFILGTRQATLTHYQSENPDALAAAFHRAVSLTNAMFERVSDDPELGVKISGGPTTVQGREMYAYEFDFANIRHFQEWVNRLVSIGNPEMANLTLVRVHEDFRLFIAALPHGVLFGAGELTADEFAERAEAAENGSEKPFLDQPPVAEVAEALHPRQISAALIDAAGLMYMSILQNVTAYDALVKPGQVNPFRVAMPRFSDELIRNGSAFGFAIGADNGLLTGRIVIPARAINSIVQNQELFSRIQREELPRMMRERQGQPDTDGPVDDGGDDGDNEGEEIELDEEPGVA